MRGKPTFLKISNKFFQRLINNEHYFPLSRALGLLTKQSIKFRFQSEWIPFLKSIIYVKLLEYINVMMNLSLLGGRFIQIMEIRRELCRIFWHLWHFLLENSYYWNLNDQKGNYLTFCFSRDFYSQYNIQNKLEPSFYDCFCFTDFGLGIIIYYKHLKYI